MSNFFYLDILSLFYVYHILNIQLRNSVKNVMSREHSNENIRMDLR